MVSPAPAGMIPNGQQFIRVNQREPRTRGDDPSLVAVSRIAMQ